jgi:hypothetical protein
MSHPLSGFASVDESAGLVRHYRYAAERMMRILGGWIALTPELSAKLVMGRHVWDNAQHADALGRRLPELRSQAQVSEPATPAFVAFMDAIEEPERPHQTVERLVGIYRVLKPHLLAAYEEHLRTTNEVYEPPTRRVLARCADDERRHIAAGRVVLDHLVATPEAEARARAWHDRLQALLAASGGVTGRGLPTPVVVDRGVSGGSLSSGSSLSDDARELIALEQSGRGWAVPPALQSAVQALGDAIVSGDADGIRRSLLPSAESDDAVRSLLAVKELSTHRMLAFTKVGAQRLIKLRLEGPGGAITLAARWVPGGDGWRAASLDVVAAPATRPA